MKQKLTPCAGGADVDIYLVELGYMQPFTSSWLPYYNCIVTDEGERAVREQSPKPPILTRSQRRYREFLSWADAYGGTFREFLAYKKAQR